MTTLTSPSEWSVCGKRMARAIGMTLVATVAACSGGSQTVGRDNLSEVPRPANATPARPSAKPVLQPAPVTPAERARAEATVFADADVRALLALPGAGRAAVLSVTRFSGPAYRDFVSVRFDFGAARSGEVDLWTIDVDFEATAANYRRTRLKLGLHEATAGEATVDLKRRQVIGVSVDAKADGVDRPKVLKTLSPPMPGP